MKNEETKTTLIRIRISTKARLDALGSKNDSYSDIVERLLDDNRTIAIEKKEKEA